MKGGSIGVAAFGTAIGMPLIVPTAVGGLVLFGGIGMAVKNLKKKNKKDYTVKKWSLGGGLICGLAGVLKGGAIGNRWIWYGNRDAFNCTDSSGRISSRQCCWNGH